MRQFDGRYWLAALLVLVALAWTAGAEEPLTLEALKKAIQAADQAKDGPETVRLAQELIARPDVSAKDRVWARQYVLRGVRKTEGVSLDEVAAAADAIVQDKAAVPRDCIVAYTEVGQYARKLGEYDQAVEWLNKAWDVLTGKNEWKMWNGDAVGVVLGDIVGAKIAAGDKAGARETLLTGLKAADAHDVPLRAYFLRGMAGNLLGFIDKDKELQGEALCLNAVARTKSSKDICDMFDLISAKNAYFADGVSAETKAKFLQAVDGLTAAAKTAEKTGGVDPAITAGKITTWRKALE